MSTLGNGLRMHLNFAPRDSHESHRAATMLELLFDLVSVIAIASVAAGLHHAVADGHAWDGLWTYLAGFFAIWWAWMNYSWFASAYDDDSVGFRLLTMVIMFGALVMAGGMAQLIASLDLTMVVIGYVIMRLGMIALWLGAARGDSTRRDTAIRYAMGIGLVQVYWLIVGIFGSTEGTAIIWLLLIGIVAELTVPLFAERSNTTPWHRHHIIERYGLLNIIVLGETLLAGNLALQSSLADGLTVSLVWIAVCGSIIVFALWWLYFCKEDHLVSDRKADAFAWGYGHFIIFAAGAAVGAGFAVQVDLATQHAHTTQLAGDMSVALPMAFYIMGLWLIRDRQIMAGRKFWLLPGMAVVYVICAFLPFALTLLSVAAATTVWLRNSDTLDQKGI